MNRDTPLEQIVKIKKQYIAYSIVLSLLMIIVKMIERIKDVGFLSMVEIEFIFIFGFTFTFLLIIFLINNIIESKIKYYIFSILLINFGVYLFFTLNVVYYTFVQNLTNAIVYTGILTLISISIYLFSKKINSLFFLFISLLIVLIFSITISYHIGLNQRDNLETSKLNEEIYIEAGIVINKLKEYMILSKISNKKFIDRFEKLQRIKKEFIIMDLELIAKTPLLLNILIEHGYCKQWSLFLENNDFKTDINISIILDKLNEKCRK